MWKPRPKSCHQKYLDSNPNRSRSNHFSSRNSYQSQRSLLQSSRANKTANSSDLVWWLYTFIKGLALPPVAEGPVSQDLALYFFGQHPQWTKILANNNWRFMVQGNGPCRSYRYAVSGWLWSGKSDRKKEGWTVTELNIHASRRNNSLLLKTSGYNGKGEGRMTKSSISWAWWCETLIPANTRRPLQVQDQSGLHTEFEDSQG